MALDFARHVPFIKHLGVRLESVGEGQSTIVLDLRPEHHNSHQMAHGGILLTMMDICMATAGRSAARPHGGGEELGLLTIELKTSFMQPATGQRIIARGRCVHRTTSMCFCEGELQDEHGHLVARASGTFRYMRAKPQPHHDTKPTEERE